MRHYIKENLTVPNLLSFIWIVIILPMAKCLLKQNYIAAGAMLLISAISDALDGFIARKFNQVTQLGKILDPIADKLTLIALVVCINIIYPDIVLFVMCLFAKEMLMLSGGAVLLNFKIRPPAAKWYGKISTVIFYVPVITLVVLKALWGYTNRTLTITLLAVTTAFMMFSLVMYFTLFVKLVREKRIADKKVRNLTENENKQTSE